MPAHPVQYVGDKLVVGPIDFSFIPSVPCIPGTTVLNGPCWIGAGLPSIPTANCMIGPGLGGPVSLQVLGVANFVQDIVLQRFFPETYELKQANKIGGTDPTMSTTREDIRAQRETLKQVQEALAKPPVETPASTKKVSPAAALQVTTDDNPAPMPAPRQRVQPKPRVAPVAATAPAAPKESAYGASGKELYMKAKGQNPLMKRYFGENYSDTERTRRFT